MLRSGFFMLVFLILLESIWKTSTVLLVLWDSSYKVRLFHVRGMCLRVLLDWAGWGFLWQLQIYSIFSCIHAFSGVYRSLSGLGCRSCGVALIAKIQPAQVGRSLEAFGLVCLTSGTGCEVTFVGPGRCGPMWLVVGSGPLIIFECYAEVKPYHESLSICELGRWPCRASGGLPCLRKAIWYFVRLKLGNWRWALLPGPLQRNELSKLVMSFLTSSSLRIL